MKAFVCGQLVPTCDAAFEAETEAELLDQIVDHARDAHGMPEVPPEVMDRIRSSIIDR